MALKTAAELDVDGGDRKLIDSRADVSTWKTGTYFATADTPFVRWYGYKETTDERTYKWWGLTKGAAEGAVEAHDQNECDSGTGVAEENASYDCSVDDRVVGSYTLTKTISSKTLEVEITEEDKAISGT